MRHWPALLLLTLSALYVTEGAAQVYRGGNGNRYAYPYNGYGGGYHASTAAEGAGYGMAAMTQAVGERNLNNSEAAKNYEEAYSKDLDNRLKSTETYFEMRRVNEAYQKEKADAEKQKRLANAGTFREAVDPYTVPLTAVELDPLSGQIAWPVALMDEKYAKFRTPLDSQFETWSSLGHPNSSITSEIKNLTDAFLIALKEDIKTFTPNDYLAGKKFITRLAHTSRFPA